MIFREWKFCPPKNEENSVYREIELNLKWQSEDIVSQLTYFFLPIIMGNRPLHNDHQKFHYFQRISCRWSS